MSEFDDQELKDFGVSKLGWQKKLMRRSREELQKRCATSTSEPPCTQSTNGTLMDHSSSTLGLFLSPIAAVPSPEVLMAQVKSLSVEEDEISQVARPWDGNGWRGLHAKFERFEVNTGRGGAKPTNFASPQNRVDFERGLTLPFCPIEHEHGRSSGTSVDKSRPYMPKARYRVLIENAMHMPAATKT